MRRQATADLESLQRIFTIPEAEHSTLAKIEQALSDNIQGFLQNSIVAAEMAPAELEKNFSDSRIPEDPVFVSEQADFLMNKVVAQSVHTASPHFVGHMTSALPYFMLPLTKLMVALNQNVVKIETSKAFTPLERQVVAMLHRLVFANSAEWYKTRTHHTKHSLGVFCSGGTVANMTALWVARNTLLGKTNTFAGVSQAGLMAAMKHYGYTGLTLLVSRRGHYSLSKTADLLGLGKAEVRMIATDAHNRAVPQHLEEQLEDCRQQKIGVIAVVGIAGTTETGQVDPLATMAALCATYGCHFHVDAAWGGPTLFSSTYRHLLKGIELADSVCFDAHKQLYIPMGAAVALFRNPSALSAIEQHANYIIRAGSRDLGKHTLEGSRPGMAMLVHSGLRIMGRKGYELLIDQGIEKAKRFAALIRAQDDFELMSEPELNLLCYRYVPSELKPSGRFHLGHHKFLNRLNISLQKIQRAAGKSFVSRTKLQPHAYAGHDTDVLRVVLANPLTTDDILKDMLAEQRQLGARIWADFQESQRQKRKIKTTSLPEQGARL